MRGQVMKIVSQLLLVIFAVVTLTACGEMGKGPEKPKNTSSSQLPVK
jgi:predicted small lipoprotein YifL